MYPHSIQQLVKAFARLPGVGQRAGERFVFHLLHSGKKDVAEFSIALQDLFTQIKSCERCWNFTDTNPCRICSNEKRDHSLLCIVEKSQDVEAIESIGSFSGTYFVLRGLIKSENPRSLAKTKISLLFSHIKQHTPKEIILALNPNIGGETTMLYLSSQIKTQFPDIKITRLARGIPMGGDILYADEITLDSALKKRSNI
jgi:recombination protein RecR